MAAHRSSTSRPERYLADVQGRNGIERQTPLEDLDVVMLRNDPADDAVDGPGRSRGRRGVRPADLGEPRLVLNDPGHLANALNKAYFQHFPETVRPRTLISRDAAIITDFVADLGGRPCRRPGIGRQRRVPGV